MTVRTVVKETRDILVAYSRLARMSGGFYSLADQEKLIISEDEYNDLEPLRPIRNRHELEQEKNAIIKAWQQVEDERDRLILYYRYFAQESKGFGEISLLIDRSSKTVEHRLGAATLNFAENYKRGILLNGK